MANNGELILTNKALLPDRIFQFIVDLFEPLMLRTKVKLEYEFIPFLQSKLSNEKNFNERLLLNTIEHRCLPECLLGDRRRLTQILINLVNNARKFTKSGTIKILSSYDYID